MALLPSTAPVRVASIRTVSILVITVATSMYAMAQPPNGASQTELRQYYEELARNRQLIAHRLSPLPCRFLITAEFSYEDTQPPEWRLSTDNLFRLVLSDDSFVRSLSRRNRPPDSLIDLANELNESWPIAIQTAIQRGDQSLLDQFEVDERRFHQEILQYYNDELPEEFESLSCQARVNGLGLRRYLQDVEPAAFANVEDSLSDLSNQTKAFIFDCLLRHSQTCLPGYLRETDTEVLDDLQPIPIEALVAITSSSQQTLPQQLQELPLRVREELFQGNWVYTQARFLRGPTGKLLATNAVQSTFPITSPLEHFQRTVPSELSSVQVAELRRLFANERDIIVSHEDQSLRTPQFREWVYDHKRLTFSAASDCLLPHQIDEFHLMAKLLNYVSLGPEALGALEPTSRALSRAQIESANDALLKDLDGRERQLKARIRSLLSQHYSNADLSFLELDTAPIAFLELVARFNTDGQRSVQDD